MTLSTRMAELRTKRGETLQQVADAVGVSKAHIWEMERNKAINPSMALVQKIAAHFGVPLGFLIGEDVVDGEVDDDLVRLFRQANELHPDDRAVLDDMVQAMLKRRTRSPSPPESKRR